MVKKVHSGRFGSKYGKSLREDVIKIERKYRDTLYKCPSCSRTAIERTASGVWQCKKCSKKFASTAYAFNG
jgi:large subunit ribosomal protein L37Ae